MTALARLLLATLLGLLAIGAKADPAQLREKYAQLREPLRHNPYHRPIAVDSAESGNHLKGDIYAVLDHPYDALEKSLQDPRDWCAILILPFNTISCHPAKAENGSSLAMRVGRKPDQPADEAYRLQFSLQPVAAGPDYFEARLASREGPVGTRDYRITLEAIPLEGNRTFMHMGYEYSYGGMGRFAMQAYLNTAGANKVGFSVVGRDGNGEPIYIGGVRGAIERNVMRYYLAVDAHLASLSAPPDQRLERSMETWFDSAERYARQLHEMDRSQYIALKKSEAGRQQASAD
jgi:hypothetical protein